MGRGRTKRHVKIREGREKYVFQILKTMFGKSCLVHVTMSLVSVGMRYRCGLQKTLLRSLGLEYGINRAYRRVTFRHYLINVMHRIINFHPTLDTWATQSNAVVFLDTYVTTLKGLYLNDFDVMDENAKKHLTNKIIRQMKEHKDILQKILPHGND